MSLTAWYKRQRHGRGFGVHSPFAYAMVREVLRPGRSYAYYDEARLRRAGVVSRKDLRLILRLCARFQPEVVCVAAPDACRGAVERAVKAGCSHAQVSEINAEFAIATPGVSIPADCLKIYFTAGSDPRVQEIAEKMTCGHLYRNPHRALFIGLEYLPKQVFEIQF